MSPAGKYLQILIEEYEIQQKVTQIKTVYPNLIHLNPSLCNATLTFPFVYKLH